MCVCFLMDKRKKKSVCQSADFAIELLTSRKKKRKEKASKPSQGMWLVHCPIDAAFGASRAFRFVFLKAGHEPSGLLSSKSRGGDVHRGASAKGSAAQSPGQVSVVMLERSRFWKRMGFCLAHRERWKEHTVR